MLFNIQHGACAFAFMLVFYLVSAPTSIVMLPTATATAIAILPTPGAGCSLIRPDTIRNAAYNCNE